MTKRERLANNRLREDIRKYMRQFFPKADAIEPHMYNHEWYVEVWKDHAATIHAVPQEALLS